MLLFTPFLVVVLVAIVLIGRDAVADGASGGRIVGLVLAGFVALLLAFQVIQAARDLLAEPVETTGVVERFWSRSDFFLFQNTYAFVEGQVFRLSPEEALDIELGDTVRVVHYPHTSALETIEVVQRAAEREDQRDG